MTEIDTEFEENSFDDEFGPEDEESVPVDKYLLAYFLSVG